MLKYIVKIIQLLHLMHVIYHANLDNAFFINIEDIYIYMIREYN